MNASYEAVQTALPQLRYPLLTYGTAYVYRLAGDEYGGAVGRVVSNCHKLPERTFVRERVSLETLLQTWRPLIERLRERFPRADDHSDGEPRASSAVTAPTAMPSARQRSCFSPRHSRSSSPRLAFISPLTNWYSTSSATTASMPRIWCIPSPLAQRIAAERFTTWALDEAVQKALPLAHRLHQELRHPPLTC